MFHQDSSNSTPGCWNQYSSAAQAQPALSDPALTRVRWNEVEKRLLNLIKLRPGWDGHSAQPLDQTAVYFSLNVIAPLIRADLPEPFIAPLASGSLQFEWSNGATVLEIEVKGAYDVSVYYEESPESEPQEFAIRKTDLSQLAKLFARASSKLTVRS